ncbi:alpha/beta fold hydrolase [Streptomyces sp. NPDC050504]|uniref:alpha/beta hydrolase n=1 Tax=Streptomyces sp. NPDC050504 TaxID=3365618 RepID=UPI0037B56C88
MTAFILVPGTFTGGWIWQDTAERLRAAGASAHPVTLSVPGGRQRTGAPGADLETHVREVVALIDSLADESDLVLVGHDYGVHPMVGAADRRPSRVARLVHLDTGLVRDGDPALALVPDRELRERLSGARGDVAPPSADGWRLWGSTAGVPDGALARLVERAAPQPVRTLTEPLRLSGAADALPVSGVLCTANGSSIAGIENLVRLGDPRLLALAEPRVSFLELDTGHWPMLSRPAELAALLLRAAAGEGRRVDAKPSEEPAHLRPFLLDVPDVRRERVGRVDLHLPDGPGGPSPAVVFVHGGPVPAELRPTPRDWPTYAGYGSYVAGLGAVGVTVDHRLHDLSDYGRAADDVSAAVDLVRADPRVDADRVALWFVSGGGLLSADWLAAPPPWLRCVAATYPVLAPLPNWGLSSSRFRPAAALPKAGGLPIVLTRVGLESPEIAATVEEFVTAATACDARLEIVDVPNAHHGFEAVDHTDEARHAVRDAVRRVLAHLTS